MNLKRRGERWNRHFNHCGTMALLRLLERLIESIRICFNSFRAEDFSQLSKAWVLEICSYHSVPIARPLITQQRTESVVDEYQGDNIDAVLHGGCQFWQGVHESAISRKAHNRL